MRKCCLCANKEDSLLIIIQFDSFLNRHRFENGGQHFQHYVSSQKCVKTFWNCSMETLIESSFQHVLLVQPSIWFGQVLLYIIYNSWSLSKENGESNLKALLCVSRLTAGEQCWPAANLWEAGGLCLTSPYSKQLYEEELRAYQHGAPGIYTAFMLG